MTSPAQCHPPQSVRTLRFSLLNNSFPLCGHGSMSGDWSERRCANLQASGTPPAPAPRLGPHPPRFRMSTMCSGIVEQLAVRCIAPFNDIARQSTGLAGFPWLELACQCSRPEPAVASQQRRQLVGDRHDASLAPLENVRKNLLQRFITESPGLGGLRPLRHAYLLAHPAFPALALAFALYPLSPNGC